MLGYDGLVHRIFGLERLAISMEARPRPASLTILSQFGDIDERRLMQIAGQLRASGKAVLISERKGRSTQRVIEEAIKNDASHIMLVGPTELESGVARLVNASDRTSVLTSI